jgi:endonuclease III related protein
MAVRNQLRERAGKTTAVLGSRKGAARRLRAMYVRLVRAYGPQQWWPAQSSFEVVVGAYLTQNTAWKSVERSIANLAAGGALTVEGLRSISEEELRRLIRPSGFMLRKSAALKGFVDFLDKEYGGQMDALRHEALADPPAVRMALLALPGVGPETADAILLYALGAPVMMVDEYLRRVVVRHGLLADKAKYGEIQTLAIQSFGTGRRIPCSAGPSDRRAELARHYNEFHALMVQIGKLHCGRVARCEECPLRYDLAAAGRIGSPA